MATKIAGIINVFLTGLALSKYDFTLQGRHNLSKTEGAAQKLGGRTLKII